MADTRNWIVTSLRIVFLTGLLAVAGFNTQAARAANCGPLPLPPCQGQGTDDKPATNSSSSPTTSSDTSLVISNIFIKTEPTKVSVQFQTSINARGTVILFDPAVTTSQSTQREEKFDTSHNIVLDQLPLDYNLKVTIVVTSETGLTAKDETQSAKYSGQTSGSNTQQSQNQNQNQNSSQQALIPTKDGNPSTNSSNPRTALQGGPLQQTLALFLSQRVLTLGQQIISWADILRWLLLFFLLMATILEVFFFLKRRRLWGVVYDARTKQPVELAVIRLFDQEHHKLLETRVTPKSGRYSFLAEPGEYYLEVTKEGFHFPSRIVTGSIDNEYTNIYLGHVIKLGAGQSLVAPDIPVDSESGVVQKPGFFRRVLIPMMDQLRFPILLVATIFAVAFEFLFRVPLGAINKNPGDFLVLGGLGLVIVLVTIEFLFVRRGRK